MGSVARPSRALNTVTSEDIRATQRVRTLNFLTSASFLSVNFRQELLHNLTREYLETRNAEYKGYALVNKLLMQRR